MSKTVIPPAPTLRLSNGVEMPRLGLGTWPMDDRESARAVAQAIETGYRLVDTAENYGNEAGVGEGLRASGVAREELFVTTKFNRKWHSREGVREATDRALKTLGLDYIDLMLIHWPNPDQDRYVEAFEGLLEMVEAGKIRAAGVSNFKPAHLQKLFDAGMMPVLNQIEQDPYHRREDLVKLHEAKGIATESWSPLGRAGALLDDPAIVAIARAHGVSTGQVVLRWHIQSGFVTTPKSADARRQAENLDIFGFTLTESEFAVLNGLGREDGSLTDADTFGH
ncbi:aldo/keto reductase [Thioclava sp. GXIMD4216]|uniref:aldo/keto reductase n=1 Tax=Thioclava sp. GXIMD4216 TaxID=3131929 RepID=UPI0030CF3669